MYKNLLLFAICGNYIFSGEISVDLKNPVYRQGTLYTEEGGVIQNEEIRIQAKKIQYIQRNDPTQQIHSIEAEGDLLIQYKGRAYVGEKLEYDFVTQTGTVFRGTTSAAMWFVSGDEICLHPDGSYNVKNVSVTTCENKDSSWDLHASRAAIWKKNLFEAEKVRYRLFKIPMLWLPSFKANLQKFKEPIFRYTLNWDKGQGPRAAIRYQLYSWEDFALYGRIEYRWKTGWGGALETEYFPEHKRTTFVTRSYLGKDRLETAPDAMRRYRLQGALRSLTENEKTKTILTWDKYNDVRMPTVFKPDDFEVDTAKKTQLYVHHKEPQWIAIGKARPRVNPFESIQQDLPSVYGHLHPHAIGKTGIYHFFSTRAGFLDFAYSDQLIESLHDFRSIRVEIQDKLERPISLGPTTLTPFVGAQGVLYSNSPTHNTQFAGVFSYGVHFSARGYKQFTKYLHAIEPYADFTGISHPTTSPDRHYIFSIQDGINHIQQLQIGIKNLLFSKKRIGKEASFTADLYANGFFADPTIPQFIPRLYLLLQWNLPSVYVQLYNAWNFRHQQMDFAKGRLLWTIGENVALTFEGRYRSCFDWRKADHDNFILDVTRSERELLLSPLSDRRITFLAEAFIRLNPLWEAKISSLQGFYRINEKPYTEVKIDLSTWISSSFKARLSYSHVRNDDRVSFHLDMVKKKL